MPCYAISIREDKQHLLKDNGGFLFFRKKSLADGVCESMNMLRKSMKLDQVYSVCKVDEKDWKGLPIIYDQEYENDTSAGNVIFVLLIVDYWKTFPIIYDQEYENDTSAGNVSGYTKRAALHGGSDGSDTDTKGSKGSKTKSKGSTQALPF